MNGIGLFASVGIVILAAVGFLSGCTPAPERNRWEHVKSDIRRRYPNVAQLDTRELARRLTEGTSLMIIDVREPEEYAVSRIPGARNSPGGRGLLKELLPTEARPPLVLYCSVGYRSAEVARRLQRAGLSEVYNLEGSIFQWANEGRLLEGPDGTVTTRVHPYDSNWGTLLEDSVRGEGGG